MAAGSNLINGHRRSRQLLLGGGYSAGRHAFFASINALLRSVANLANTRFSFDCNNFARGSLRLDN